MNTDNLEEKIEREMSCFAMENVGKKSEIVERRVDSESHHKQKSFVLEPRFLNVWGAMSKYIKYYLYINILFMLCYPVLMIFSSVIMPADQRLFVVLGSLFVVGMMVVLVAYPLYKLWCSSKNMKLAVDDLNEENLEVAIRCQKSFWKYLTILLIVSLVLTIIFFIVKALIGALALLVNG